MGETLQIMENKNDIKKTEKTLKDKKIKKLIMIAPSFLTDFEYPKIISQLKGVGFDKVMEVTFGAKMVNREYHQLLKEKSNNLCISTTCPGISKMIKNNPELKVFEKNLAKIDSPMKAMAKISKKFYPKHQVFFLSPCHMKKVEAQKIKEIDFVIDFQQMRSVFEKQGVTGLSNCIQFDRFYNDYTKVYPLSGGLTKTSKIDGILSWREYKIRDGWKDVEKLLLKIKNNPQKYKKLKFLDVTFCQGGCIGGPCTNQNLSIRKKKKRVIKYMKDAKREKIPDNKLGVIELTKGINFAK